MAYVSDAPRERAKLLAPCFLRGDSGTTESSHFALSSMLAPPTLARNVVVVPSAKQSASTSLSICSRLEGRSEPPTTPSIRAASSLCAITRGSPRSVRASHRPVADHRSRAAAASVCCRTASSISAARRASHFKELRTYYFHNCIYGVVYPTEELSEPVPIPQVIGDTGRHYQLVLVGDALMAAYELLDAPSFGASEKGASGLGW